MRRKPQRHQGTKRILRIGVCFHVDVLLLPRYKQQLNELDVIVFPELMDGGYATLRGGRKPHTVDDGYVVMLQNASKEFSNTIIAGSIFLKTGTRRPTNTSLVFSRGKLIHRYDKMHLFKPTGDTKFFMRGSKASTFTLRVDSGEVRAGIVICYDLRFPELTRALAFEGMTILFLPARWPKIRDDAWQTLLKARAIENQIFAVGCNSLDGEGGNSCAYDPTGKLMFSNRKSPFKLLQTFQIDLKTIHEAKKHHRNLPEAIYLKKFIRRT